MLSQAIGNLLPFAMAVALSPIPIIGIVVVLGTPKARTNGPAFAVGWLLGLTVVMTAVLVFTNGSDQPDSAASNTTNAVSLALGLVLLALAVKQWKKRPKPGEEPTLPAWMATVDTLNSAKALALGVAMSVLNPKNLILAAGAAASIAQAGLSTADTALAAAVFVVLASVTVVGAVLFHLLAGQRAVGPLGTLKEFMAQHSAVIMMVILLILGAKLVGDGLGGLG
jgi:threonine/homoserine/homoserine lactone efflux protein